MTDFLATPIVSWGYHNKLPQLGGTKQKLISPQFRRPDILKLKISAGLVSSGIFEGEGVASLSPHF